jgi:hypothetical protein
MVPWPKERENPGRSRPQDRPRQLYEIEECLQGELVYHLQNWNESNAERQCRRGTNLHPEPLQPVFTNEKLFQKGKNKLYLGLGPCPNKEC